MNDELKKEWARQKKIWQLSRTGCLVKCVAICFGLRDKGYFNGAIHANQNYPGNMQQPLRSNLERIEKSVHEVFDLVEQRGLIT